MAVRMLSISVEFYRIVFRLLCKLGKRSGGGDAVRGIYLGGDAMRCYIDLALYIDLEMKHYFA